MAPGIWPFSRLRQRPVPGFDWAAGNGVARRPDSLCGALPARSFSSAMHLSVRIVLPLVAALGLAAAGCRPGPGSTVPLAPMSPAAEDREPAPRAAGPRAGGRQVLIGEMCPGAAAGR